jgi:hypothetical protein
VSAYADRHHRFGPSLLHRYLPFFFATFIERLIILLVPLIVVIVPLVNLLPQLLAGACARASIAGTASSRSSSATWHRARATLAGAPLAVTLDRIEAQRPASRRPTSYASEATRLREHIAPRAP